ncbi:MAG: nitroreductase family protein [Myxococcota bacterium]|jgi:nitroreductase|nr:nitroreductase family protein [Myxococcota bacterium]
MDFFEVLRNRYSVRAYRPDPVPDELLQQVLEAARLAPTACNRQPFVLHVLPTAGKEAALRRIYPRDWFIAPPYVIAVSALTGPAWARKDGKSYAEVDATIAFDHLILAAAALGLGTCWIGAFDPDAARAVLGLGPDEQPLAFTPLGWPADLPRTKQRKPLSELVRQR